MAVAKTIDFLQKNTTCATLVNTVDANCKNTTKLLYSAPNSKLRVKEVCSALTVSTSVCPNVDKNSTIGQGNQSLCA